MSTPPNRRSKAAEMVAIRISIVHLPVERRIAMLIPIEITEVNLNYLMSYINHSKLA